MDNFSSRRQNVLITLRSICKRDNPKTLRGCWFLQISFDTSLYFFTIICVAGNVLRKTLIIGCWVISFLTGIPMLFDFTTMPLRNTAVINCHFTQETIPYEVCIVYMCVFDWNIQCLRSVYFSFLLHMHVYSLHKKHNRASSLWSTLYLCILAYYNCNNHEYMLFYLK